MIEGGFLTEGGESKLIANKEWRGKLAQAISVGIDNYKSLADNKQPPLLVRDYTRKIEDSFAAEARGPSAATSVRLRPRRPSRRRHPLSHASSRPNESADRSLVDAGTTSALSCS